jgi:hypothetical protein
MNSPGNYFLAGTALSYDKHGYVGRGDFGDDAFEGSGRRADKVDKYLVITIGLHGFTDNPRYAGASQFACHVTGIPFRSLELFGL